MHDFLRPDQVFSVGVYSGRRGKAVAAIQGGFLSGGDGWRGGGGGNGNHRRGYGAVAVPRKWYINFHKVIRIRGL